MDYHKSQELYNEYAQYIFKVSPFMPGIMSRGEGCYLWDIDNNRYLDLMAGQFCVPFGHNYKPFNAVVSNQLKQISHTNTLTLSQPVFNAAKKVSEIAPAGLNKSILLSTGAEAVECALRYVKFHKKKNGIAGIASGYHGLTLAAQSISSGGKWAQPCVTGSVSIPSPDWLYRSEDMSADEFIDQCLILSENIISQNAHELAALVIEPIISVGGMIFPPERYFRKLYEVCRSYDVLFVADECQTGFGRTGRWFGMEHYGVDPDVLIFAKSCGMGLAVSGVIFSDYIAEAVEDKLIHFSSHQNDPLSGAAISFVIDHVKEENLLQKVVDIGAYLLERLEEVSRENEWIRYPRGVGLMIGFDLPFEKFEQGSNPGQKLINLLREEGVIIQAIRQGRTFRVLPAYTISREDIDCFISALKNALKKM